MGDRDWDACALGAQLERGAYRGNAPSLSPNVLLDGSADEDALLILASNVLSLFLGFLR
jgi:hypothetical protein